MSAVSCDSLHLHGKQSSDSNLIVHCGPSAERIGGIRTVMEELSTVGIDGLNPIIVPTSSKTRRIPTFLKGYAEFARLVRDGNVACLHVHMSENASVYRTVALIRKARRHDVPVIVHSHGGEIKEFLQSRSERIRRWLCRQIARSDVLVALTPEWAAWWASLIPDMHIEVIPNSVSVPPRSHLRFPVGSQEVVFLGELCDKKGVRDLMHAIPIVLDDFPDAVFHFAGGGEAEGYRALGEELGIGASCRFHGWADASKKERLLQACSMLVLPSHFESFGIVLLEAMSYARPVICSNGGHMREIIDDGVDGLVFRRGDGVELAQDIIALLRDPEKAREMGERGRRKTEERYSRSAIRSRWKQLYMELTTK